MRRIDTILDVDDARRVQKILAEKAGYLVDLREAADLWEYYSDTMSASWLIMPKSDDDLWETLADYYQDFFEMQVKKKEMYDGFITGYYPEVYGATLEVSPKDVNKYLKSRRMGVTPSDEDLLPHILRCWERAWKKSPNLDLDDYKLEVSFKFVKTTTKVI